MVAVQASDFIAPGLLAIVAATVGGMFKLMQAARRDGYDLAEERAEDAKFDRARSAEEISRLHERVDSLEKQVVQQRHDFEAELLVQRTLKHDAVNELHAVKMLLATIRGLTGRCTCGALAPVAAILESYPAK